MDKRRRYERVKAIVRRLNVQRRKQAQQINILCDDIIQWQRDFMAQLKFIGGKADFYERLLGCGGLDAVLCRGHEHFSDHLGGVCTAYYLRNGDSFTVRVFDHENIVEAERLDLCFDDELFRAVCRLNKVCSLDELCQQGLQARPVVLSRTAAVTLPLSGGGQDGFVLLYRQGDTFRAKLISQLYGRTRGLSDAVATWRNTTTKPACTESN